jgi:hypothetical protein
MKIYVYLSYEYVINFVVNIYYNLVCLTVIIISDNCMINFDKSHAIM